MKYITHTRYRGIDILGNQLNLPYGTELELSDNFIALQDKTPICFPTSEVAKMYFARNDDGCGLERGVLTHAIAYGQRSKKCSDGSIHRFSDEEAEMLKNQYNHWLRQDTDTILFNDDFFAAQPEDLQRLADALEIKIKR